MRFEFTLPEHFDGWTMRRLMDLFSLAKKKRRILETESLVFVNGDVSDESVVLSSEDRLSFNLTRFEGRDFVPANESVKVLYEDDWILVADKPAGVTCYNLDSDKPDTLANMVSKHYEDTMQDLKIRHLHRIDKYTTGIVLYAKNILSHAYTTQMWDTEQVVRSYLAIVEGRIEEEEGVIDRPIGSDRHQNNRYLVSRTGKRAVTHFRVLSRSRDRTLVECVLETGRTHQIRVHMSSIGHPLVGDSTYGAKTKAPRYYLHSYQARLFHPIRNDWIQVTAPLPKDMDDELLKCGMKPFKPSISD